MYISRSGTFLCLASLWFSSCESQVNCYNESQCEGDSLSTSDDINCYGFSSCYDASLIWGTTTSSDAECYGSFACDGADSMEIAGSMAQCYGSHSCSNIDTIVLPYFSSDLYCHGEKSCYGSIVAEINEYLYCYGDQSCAEGAFNVSGIAYIYGYKAGYNSVFSSAASGAEFYFDGVLTGQRAEVICNEGHECYIYCGGDACNSVTITCDRCSDFNVSCDTFSELSFACPSGSDVSKWTGNNGDMDVPDLDEVLTNYAVDADGHDVCLDNTVRSCGDYFDPECNDMAIIEETSVCCTGHYGCLRTNITTTSGDIRCDGMFDFFWVMLFNCCVFPFFGF